MSFHQDSLCTALQSRRLLCQTISQAHQKTLDKINKKPLSNWTVHLGSELIFDLVGLKSIKQRIQTCNSNAEELHFKLKLSTQATRDYYSHHYYLESDGLVRLPVTAIRTNKTNKKRLSETLVITLEELSTPTYPPLALTPSDINSTPLALLMPYSCDHDCLFANQIAVFSNINSQVKRSPISWLKALLSRRKVPLKQRISLAWKHIHPSADIHPSAIIEGSVIGKGCRIGAHCVVRYSILGNDIQLHDGAKVEFSVVDQQSWLMHDLVLYRCLVEPHVFLIHGPYQFSFFQQQSAAFASIIMDYRPDNKSIRINTPQGVRDYQGRFLGALLEEKAKIYAGTLTAPGITIPKKQQIMCDIDNITTAKKLQKTNETNPRLYSPPIRHPK